MGFSPVSRVILDGSSTLCLDDPNMEISPSSDLWRSCERLAGSDGLELCLDDGWMKAGRCVATSGAFVTTSCLALSVFAISSRICLRFFSPAKYLSPKDPDGVLWPFGTFRFFCSLSNAWSDSSAALASFWHPCKHLCRRKSERSFLG